MKNAAKSLLAAPLVIIAALSAPGPGLAEEGGGAAPAEKMHRGTYWYFVDNIVPDPSNPSAAARVRLWAALPLDRPGQEVKILGFKPEPSEILESEGGNRVAFWSVENPDPGKQLVFRYDFEIRNLPVSAQIDPAKVLPVSPDSPEAKRYTVSETWLEASPEIAARAREIAGDEKNPYLQARLIFDWVVANMTYDYPDIRNRGVTRAFSSLKGDCGEFAHVFIAMARSLGIPARSVIANWYQGSGHAWAEIHLPPYGWVPADPSGAQYVLNGLKGQQSEETVKKFMETRGIPTRDPRWLFGGLYPNRIEVFIGENAEFSAKAPGGSRKFVFMQPGGCNAWPPGIEIEGLWKRTVDAGFFLFDADADDEGKAKAEAEEQLAPALLAAGFHMRAAAGLKRKIARKPDDSMPLFQLGQAQFNLGQFEDAIGSFRLSIAGKGGSLKPTTDTWGRIFMGMSLDALGRRDEAIAEYKAAIEIGSDFQGSLALARKFIENPFKPGGR